MLYRLQLISDSLLQLFWSAFQISWWLLSQNSQFLWHLKFAVLQMVLANLLLQGSRNGMTILLLFF
jgi:hypothetical protein